MNLYIHDDDFPTESLKRSNALKKLQAVHYSKSKGWPGGGL